MPRSFRRLGRVPALLALTAILAIGSTWSVSPSWSSSLRPGPRGGQAAAAGVKALTDAGARWAAATLADGPTSPALDPEGRRLPPPVARTVVHEPAPAPAPTAAPTKKAAKYSGRNHFWFPALRMSYEVVRFPCPRQRPPGNYLYRWECAGTNNVYLMGHAYSVMKPLHDAYAKGRLRVGMLAYYADSKGRVRAYKVTKWIVSLTGKTFYWGIASQPVPSMTLQTCWGANSEYRLKVRLVAIN